MTRREKHAGTPPGRLRRVARYVTRVYVSADPRSLGLFRIALGALLFVDVARRWPDLDAHYSNAGWLPNHFALYRPMSEHLFSLYHAFSTPAEVQVLAVFQMLVSLALMLGWHARVAHVLSAVLITSLNSRAIMLENGGWVVLNLLTVWTVFLPLGRRFSIDAWRWSFRARREGTLAALADRSAPQPDRAPVVSLAVFALILQWAAIYYFNTVQKTGQPWLDGTAVYYFFQQDRMITELGAWLRGVLPLGAMKVMTWSTLVVEGSVVVLLLLPFKTHITRMIAWALVIGLHLSIDAVVELGPFSWAMIIMFITLIPPQLWDRHDARLVRKKPERWLLIDPRDGVMLSVARVIKRWDSTGRVSFVGVSEDRPRPHELPSEVTPELVKDSVVVVDPSTGTHATGRQALGWLLEALPFGWLAAAPIRLPGIGGLVERWALPAGQRREAWSRFLEVDDLPGVDTGPVPEPSPARRFARRLGAGLSTLAVAFLMVVLASQALVENPAVPAALKPRERPQWMEAIAVYPRLFQGWRMFAPAPPTDDGRVVVDGRTADGRHLDPLTGREPSFDVQPAGGFRMNQLWGDFHRRIHEPRFRPYLSGVRDFLRDHHELTGHPENRLVGFDVWFVRQRIPPPGEPFPEPTRHKLLSYGTMR